MTRRAALAGLACLPVCGFADAIVDSANVVRAIKGRYSLTVKSTGTVFGFEDFSL